MLNRAIKMLADKCAYALDIDKLIDRLLLNALLVCHLCIPKDFRCLTFDFFSWVDLPLAFWIPNFDTFFLIQSETFLNNQWTPKTIGLNYSN